MRIYKKLEVLIGLTIFNSDEIDKKDVNNFGSQDLRFRGSSDGLNKIENWYDEFAPLSIKETSKKIVRWIKTSTRLITIAAFIFGVSAAGVLFHYDGSSPINVLPVMVLFVLAPLFLLILSFIIPKILTDNSTGMNFLSELFEWIRSKADVEISKYFNQDRQDFRVGIDRQWIVYNEPVQLIFKKTLQRAAAVYVSGALLWMIFNVTTTDLAFSWSTTLQIEGETIYSISSVISTPWDWALPNSTVDLSTVEETQYFRSDRSNIAGSSSGQWWSFIFMSILVYSFIPRLISHSYYHIRLKKSLKLSLLDSSDDILQLYRHIFKIERDNEQNFTIYDNPEINKSIDTDKSNHQSVILVWFATEVNIGKLQSYVEGEILKVESVGGTTPTKNDLNIASELSKTSVKHDFTDIYVFVKIWENPSLRFDKIMTQIAEESQRSNIFVVPIIDKDDPDLFERHKSNWNVRITSLNKEIEKKRIRLETRQKISIINLL